MNYLPQFFPSDWIIDHKVFGIPFTEEISIGFIIRTTGGYSYLMNAEFKTLNIDQNRLLTEAVSNLENEFENCDIKAYKPGAGSMVFWYSESDNFTAVRILSKKYSSVLSNIFKSDFCFSIPDRDTITCWADLNQLEEAKVIRETIEDFTESEYGLSSKWYRFSEILLKIAFILPI